MKDFFRGVRRHIERLDVTHLREEYARLSDEAASLDALFATLAEGIMVLDRDGAILKANPAVSRLLGMDPEDAIDALAIPLGKASKREIGITYPDARTLEMQTVPIDDAKTLVHLRDVSAEKERTEEELFVKINSSGLGPMGLGGDTTVLGVKIRKAFCHTASLPVAVNIGCWATRRAVARITDNDVIYSQGVRL
jgi:PAS domain-containing protein